MQRRDYANTSILAQRAEQRAKQKWRLSALHWALVLSLAVHAGLLTVRFVDPERFNKLFQDTPLEVVLVNAKSMERPEIARAIAQANLAGGGDAATGRATSPLPPATTIETGDSLEDARRQVERLQEEQQQLLAQIRREVALLPPPDPAKDASDPQGKAREERRRQLLQLLAEIEKRVNEENARPKKRYISPATREADYAIYYDGLRRKIEERGTRDFPEANGKKLYGELTMNITIDAAGRLVESRHRAHFQLARARPARDGDRSRRRTLRQLHRRDAQADRPDRRHLALSLHARRGPGDDAARPGEQLRMWRQIGRLDRTAGTRLRRAAGLLRRAHRADGGGRSAVDQLPAQRGLAPADGDRPHHLGPAVGRRSRASLRV